MKKVIMILGVIVLPLVGFTDVVHSPKERFWIELNAKYFGESEQVDDSFDQMYFDYMDFRLDEQQVMIENLESQIVGLRNLVLQMMAEQSIRN